MNAVVLQPSYIPWRGYFHQIKKADIFVFYDCVEYDKHGWRNRNEIKMSQGTQWLTIPVMTSGTKSVRTPVKDIRIDWTKDWARKHLLSIQQAYAKAPFLTEYAGLLEKFYSRKDALLVDFTCEFTMALATCLGITHTQFVRSSTLDAAGTKTERLLSILRPLGVKHYISGPSARDYLDIRLLNDVGISVEFMTYNYPEYQQLHGAFQPQVSVLDLLLNIGPGSSKYVWD